MAGHAGQGRRSAIAAVDRGDHAHRQALRLPAPDPARCAAPRRPAPARACGPPRRLWQDRGRTRAARRASRCRRRRSCRAARDRKYRPPRGCRAAWSRSARPPRRRSRRSRSRKAAASRCMQRGDALDRGQHAQHAVVLAGIAHRVEMRAQHQARQPRDARPRSARRIAHRVERVAMPASRIQPSTSALACACWGDRNTRVSPPASSDSRPSAAQ